MTSPLDELYFKWLYEHIDDTEYSSRSSRTYWNLARILFTTQFVWFIPNDDNRAADGKYLRKEFIEDLDLEDVDPDWMHQECSMLEMLVALSQRLSFYAEGEPRDWFWVLLNNLEIRFNDRQTIPVAYVEEVLDRFMSRTYKRNGEGGLFPLRRPRKDQRDVEIWNQMHAYLIEQDL